MTASFVLLSLPVYYNKNTIANVLSFQQIASMKGVRITVDTAIEKAISVTVGDVTYKFRECDSGLYYIDMENINSFKTKNTVSPYSKPLLSSPSFCLLNTVENNKSLYTKQQVKRVDFARQLQQNLGWPGTKVFKNLILNNLILNCSITSDDVDRAIQIYGPPTPLLRGRMTAPPQSRHTAITQDIPKELRSIHKKIQLYVDLCYINKVAFLVTRSDSVNFITIDPLENKGRVSIIRILQNIIQLYSTRGFIISDLFGDGEFDVDDIKLAILPITTHICSTNEHVPKIERPIRTIKERCRSICHSLPFSSFLRIMTK